MGETQKQIASELGVGQAQINRDQDRLTKLALPPLKEMLMHPREIRHRLKTREEEELKRMREWEEQKRIADRQGRVMELKIQGNTQQEIAQELGVGVSIVYRDLERLRELAVDERLKELLVTDMREVGRRVRQETIHRQESSQQVDSATKRKLLAYRRGRVLEGRLLGMTEAELAEELGVVVPYISNDVRVLRGLAVDPRLKALLETDMRKGGTPTEQVEAEHRRDRVLGLGLEGKTPAEIEKELDIDEEVISEDLGTLRKKAEGPVREKLRQMDESEEKEDRIRTAERRKDVMLLRRDGGTIHGIAQALGVTPSTVQGDLNALKKLQEQLGWLELIDGRKCKKK